MTDGLTAYLVANGFTPLLMVSDRQSANAHHTLKQIDIVSKNEPTFAEIKVQETLKSSVSTIGEIHLKFGSFERKFPADHPAESIIEIVWAFRVQQ